MRERTLTKRIWENMKQRCNNPNKSTWPAYGGRGIRYDSRWESYNNFLEDMGECPPGLSLDRINNDLGYFRENCRWATPRQQSLNVRVRPRNTVGINGIHQRGNLFRVQVRGPAGSRRDIYNGTDFFLACCARKSWELANV